MKTTKTVKLRARTIKASTKEIIEITCDVCNEPIAKNAPRIVCSMCGRDAHSNLHGLKPGEYPKCAGYDERDNGDYPLKYCKICYILKFEKYEQDYQDMVTRHEKELEDLEEKIKEASLAYRKTS